MAKNSSGLVRTMDNTGDTGTPFSSSDPKSVAHVRALLQKGRREGRAAFLIDETGGGEILPRGFDPGQSEGTIVELPPLGGG